MNSITIGMDLGDKINFVCVLDKVHKRVRMEALRYWALMKKWFVATNLNLDKPSHGSALTGLGKNGGCRLLQLSTKHVGILALKINRT